MRKFYMGAIALGCSMGLFAEDVQSVVSLTLVNLTHDVMNTTYTDNQGNAIKISTGEPVYKGDNTFIYGLLTSGDNPLMCLGIPAPGGLDQYTFFTMKGHMQAGFNESPSILIELPAGDKITNLEIIGRSAGSNNTVQLFSGFSSTGTNEGDFETNWDDPTLSGDPAFLFLNNGCQTEDDRKREVPSGSKYVKLIVTEAFADFYTDNMNSVPQIYAIRFFAKDMGTSIEGDNKDAFGVELYGRNLQLSESADVLIYDVTGKVLQRYNNIDNVYLDSVNDGVYILKATNAIGQTVTQKVVVR